MTIFEATKRWLGSQEGSVVINPATDDPRAASLEKIS